MLRNFNFSVFIKLIICVIICISLFLNYGLLFYFELLLFNFNLLFLIISGLVLLVCILLSYL